MSCAILKGGPLQPSLSQQPRLGRSKIQASATAYLDTILTVKLRIAADLLTPRLAPFVDNKDELEFPEAEMWLLFGRGVLHLMAVSYPIATIPRPPKLGFRVNLGVGDSEMSIPAFLFRRALL